MKLLLILLLATTALEAQEFGTRLGAVQRGGKISFEPRGPGVLFDALDPAVRKWYVPQELYSEYGWRHEQYSNYARENYQRYVRTAIEGNYFYDLFGNFLNRGWLIFDWRQQNPQPFGSTLFKGSRFAGWFNSVVIASDHKGQYHYAITVGDEIRTTLTPLTFSKPRFNGVQIDLASDNYAATLLLSRISQPDPFEGAGSNSAAARTDNTNLGGVRVEAQSGDFVKLGGTFVNAHHSQSQNDALSGNFFKGGLTGSQNLENLSFIEILIKDDSPADDEAGGALFDADILIYDLDGNEIRGAEIGFRPLIEGGFQRRGFLAADGDEEILLRFDLLDPAYSGPEPAAIRRIRLELVVANDYLIEVGSDLQSDIFLRPVFIPVFRADGNVKDSSNQRVLAFDYGLPTANQLAGFTLELTDLEGFNGHFELNINNRWRKYPNPDLEKHHIGSEETSAWMANLSKISHPYFGFAEAFYIAPDYQTSFRTVQETGIVDYADKFKLYEFVDDNDDQDRFPDWRRRGFLPGDAVVFPGWDENNDFISDYNQNDNSDSPNRFPDYDEPFLRFHTDRPEFLYGIDMNHNGTIDRFENDEEADLPYKRDRKGYNIYLGRYLHPQLKLTLGQQRVRQIADERRNLASYLLLSGDHTISRFRLRLFQDLRKVEDTIRNDLLQWVQPPNSRGELRPVRDVLPARNTVINTTWLGLDYDAGSALKIKNVLRWQRYHQLDSSKQLALRTMREQTSFVGVINKAEYRLDLGSLSLIPALKSEFLRFSSFTSGEATRRELSEIAMLIARQAIMRSTYLETGIEYHRFIQLQEPTPPRADDDFTELTALLQLTDVSDYQGYRLTTVLGFSLSRLDSEVEDPTLSTRGFITVYAGIE
ncbi:MAG: hypothetical protein VX293_04400 [Candidatus Latescibacterota bacterium]|nr:hypothetical protein [Candidatus Latescibacterota bacterium]